jgi:peptidoglycan/xylan/chitin deacetylase (PgdA/CDA1 family)
MYLVRPPYLLKKFSPSSLWRLNRERREICLSFDDGPHPEITPWVLDQLKAAEAKAIFFCVGDNVLRYPDVYARILAEGHLTGNHTQNHLNGWSSDSKKYLSNIATCAREVKSVFFRPPYGRVKKSQSRRIRLNYIIVMWDVLSGDFDRNTSKEKCLANTLRYSREGSIVVFHDSAKAKENLQYVLPRYLEEMKQRGFGFVLPALISLPSPHPSPASSNR